MQSRFEWVSRLWNGLAGMSDFQIILGLALVVVLTTYLYIKHAQRIAALPEAQDTAAWQGKPIEVSRLRPSVDAVRLDYLAAHRSPRAFSFHRNLLALARRAVAKLSFFEAHQPEAPVQSHGH